MPTFPHTDSCLLYYRVTGKTAVCGSRKHKSQRGRQFLTVPRTVICTLSVALLCSISKPFGFLLNSGTSLWFFLKQPRADFKGLFAEGNPQESGSSDYCSTFGHLLCGFCQQGRFSKAGVPAFLSHFSVKVTFKYLQLSLPAPDLGLQLVRVGKEQGCTAACAGLASLGTQNSGLWHWGHFSCRWGSFSSLCMSSKEKNVYF